MEAVNGFRTRSTADVGSRAGQRVKAPSILIASRLFGASGQPWLWRQTMALSGFRKSVVCWERHNPESQPVLDIRVHIVPEHPAPYDSSARWLYRLRTIASRNFYAAIGRERQKLATLFEEEKPAVLLCHFGDIAMRLLPLARAKRIPLIAHFHGDFSFVTNRWYRWSLRQCLPHFAAVVVVTAAEREWMLQHGVPEAKLRVIPCGAPTELFCPRRSSRPNPALRFVMVSRLSREKGCDVSMRAFARVAAEFPDAELHVFGDGPMRQELEQLVTTLQLTRQVFFRGYVDEHSLARLLPDHDVFIQHSLVKEGSPVSISEAMACGVPVIATSVGGIGDQVVHGQSGLLVRENDTQEMASAMLRLAHDHRLRLRLGIAARSRAKLLYDSLLQTRRVEELLSNVLREAK